MFVFNDILTFAYFQFTDKLEDMLDCLATTAEQIQHVEPISAHPDKLKEQISENTVKKNCFYFFSFKMQTFSC